MTDALRVVETAVADAVAAYDLWPEGATLVVAVSGGADSLCLLGALQALHMQRPRFSGELVVATLDHGLRGPVGAEDVRWVAQLATGLSLRCVTGAVDAGALAKAERLSVEDAARRLRYQFLRSVARQSGAARICVAHTRDDQAETIVLHLLRGTGLAGLAGMRPLQGDIARPLLDVTRAETEAYCHARGWEPRQDHTNEDLRYLRNRVRHRLLPQMEEYNPNLRRTLARNAAFVAEDAALLEAMTDRAWAEVVAGEQPHAVALDLAELRAQPKALRRRLFRRAATVLSHREQAMPEGIGADTLEARHISLIENLVASGKSGATLSLPGGLRATLGYTALRLTTSHTAPMTPAADTTGKSWPLTIPGEPVEAMGWRIRAALLTTPPGLDDGALPPVPWTPPLHYGGTSAAIHRSELRVYADADVVGSNLEIRAWRPGDRFRLLGMASDKKLQDVFSDAKVPRALRHRLPLVCAGKKIVWVVGLRLGDEFKLTPHTRRFLALQAEPLIDLNAFLAGAGPPKGAQLQKRHKDSEYNEYREREGTT